MILDVLDHLHPVTLPDDADLADADGDTAINIISGLTYADYWVRVTEDDTVLRVKVMTGNGVILGEATFSHVAASIVADAIVAMTWQASERTVHQLNR